MPLFWLFAIHDTDYTATGKQRVDEIFNAMDLDKDGKLTFDEFSEGSKRDPTIVQVRTSTTTLTTPVSPNHSSLRPCPCTTVMCRILKCLHRLLCRARCYLVVCPGGTVGIIQCVRVIALCPGSCEVCISNVITALSVPPNGMPRENVWRSCLGK